VDPNKIRKDAERGSSRIDEFVEKTPCGEYKLGGKREEKSTKGWEEKLKDSLRSWKKFYRRKGNQTVKHHIGKEGKGMRKKNSGKGKVRAIVGLLFPDLKKEGKKTTRNAIRRGDE